MVCLRPYRRGISKSRSVASCIPIWTALMMKAMPSSAARRSGYLSKAWPRAELVEGPAGHHAGGLEPLDAAGAIESYLDYSGHSPGTTVRDGMYALRYLGRVCKVKAIAVLLRGSTLPDNSLLSSRSGWREACVA